jgi:RNA polymerase sigma factor (sigma-70 family)
MQSVEQIIKKCIKNDRKAQRKLYDRYASVLLGICYRYMHDKQAAEDVLQEAFVKIFKNLKQYEGKGSFEGWLKRIAVNTSISHIRKNKKHDFNQDITEIQESKLSDYSTEDAEFTHDELLKVIQALPLGYRTIFNMFAIEGYKHREIAEMLEIDISTSKSQFSRARKLIQEKLEEIGKIRN